MGQRALAGARAPVAALKVLVTGAAGFSGRHLCAALSRDDTLEVHAATRAHCDLSDASATRALVAEVGPRQIYHLAGSFSDDPAEAERAIVHATRNVLTAARGLARRCRVLLVGSAAEYGPVAEADNPVSESRALRPVGAYARAKAAQAELMRQYEGDPHLELVLARTFNLLGAGQSSRLLLGRVEAWLRTRTEGEVLVLGDLSARRDYLPIAEAVAAYRLIMHAGRPGGVYNVGSGRPTPVRDAVHALLRAHGVPPSAIEERGDVRGVGSEASAIWADITALRALAARSA